MCPGRFIAKKTVYSFLTLALSMKSCINVDKGCGSRRPRPHEETPGFGTLPPVQGDRVFVTLHEEAMKNGGPGEHGR